MLVHRIEHLLNSGVSPSQILAVTFNRDAADEMEIRTSAVHEKGEQIDISTLHSWGYGVLSQLESRWDVIERREACGFIKKQFSDVSWSSEEPPGFVFDLWRKSRRRCIPREDVDDWLHSKIEGGSPNPAKVATIIDRYEQMKWDSDQIDFSDMLYRPWEAYEKGKWEGEIDGKRHILVDEVQDLNLIQCELVLAMKEIDGPTDLHFFGDPLQSMYGWRGASVDRLKEIVEDQGLQVVDLPRNYRSRPEIVERANELVTSDDDMTVVRDSVEIEPVRQPGGEIDVRRFDSKFVEARWMAEDISERIDQGISPDQIAVLMRMNSQGSAVQRAMVREGVPFEVVGRRGFYSRKEIEEAVAYLRLAFDDQAYDSLAEVFNTPTRYLGQAFLRYLRKAFRPDISIESLLSSVQSSDYRNTHCIEYLIEDLKSIQEVEEDSSTGPEDVLERIFRLESRVDGSNFLRLRSSNEDKDSRRAGNLKALYDLAEQYSSTAELVDEMDDLMGRSIFGDDPNRVEIMTIHKSKGREFDHVYIPGMSDGILPHEDADVPAERRVAYVAVTRARDRVVIGCPDGASMFTSEMGLTESRPSGTKSPNQSKRSNPFEKGGLIKGPYHPNTNPPGGTLCGDPRDEDPWDF